MPIIIVCKYRVGAIGLLPLFLFAIPHLAAAQAGKAEKGRELFKQICANCHAVNGSGNTPIGKAMGAKDLRSAETQKMTDAQIFTQIDEGTGNMPSLSNAVNQARADDLKERVNVLVAYIRELGENQTGAIPLAAAQAGKAEKGRELFKQICAKCHAVDGSGNTPIGKAMGAKDLRSAETQKMTDAQIFTQIDEGTGNMPSLSNAVNQARADDLKERVNVLVAYIRELGENQTGAIPLAAAQAGKAEKGRELFELICAKCHAVDGSGNTPIGKAMGAKDLRSAETQKMTDAQIFTQIDEGTGNMPSLSNAVNQARADDLKERVSVLVAYIRELGENQTRATKP